MSCTGPINLKHIPACDIHRAAQRNALRDDIRNISPSAFSDMRSLINKVRIVTNATFTIDQIHICEYIRRNKVFRESGDYVMRSRTWLVAALIPVLATLFIGSNLISKSQELQPAERPSPIRRVPAAVYQAA